MYCAVGELLDEGVALSCDPQQSEEDAFGDWAEWMSALLPATDDAWIHDAMGPTPLEPLMWGEVPRSAEWMDAGGLADYDHVLGLPKGSTNVAELHASEIVVRAYIEAWASHAYDYLRLNSCLVTRESATSLQRAFQSNPDWQSNAMPTGWHDDVLDEQDFTVVSWVLSDGPEHALDEFDPFLFRRGLHLPHPTSEIVNVLKLARVGHAWYNAAGERVFWIETWSDKPRGREEDYEPYSLGTRLWVRVDTLLSYLRDSGYDLLIETAIQHHDRRDRTYTSFKEGNQDDGHAIYYLLRHDGTLSAMEHYRHFG